MFRHLPSPRVLRTAVVSLVALAATSVTSSGFAAASGGSLAASSDDTRALQGSGEGGASQACAALGGTVALHEDGTFANNETGPSGSFTWTIGQESTDPYFPGGSSLYTGSTPIQDVNFTYPSSINVLGVVVKGGTDYNVYTGSSNLTGNYISPLVGSGNVANISGFWVCAGTSTLATPSVNTTPSPSGTSATDSATVSGLYGTPTGTVTFTLYKGTSPSGTLVATYSDTATLVGGSATSTSATGLSAGNYYFLVSYSGDGSYGVITVGSPELFTIQASKASKPPAKAKKTVKHYKIPTKAPKTGFGGAARETRSGGLLLGGGLVLLSGIGLLAVALRRRHGNS